MANTAQVEFTPEQIVEYTRCMDDPTYFIKTYVKLFVENKGLIPFPLFDYQERLLDTYVNYSRVICMMPRQCGKALPLSTPLPTPTGWTTMGDLRVGDMLLGADGKPVKVSFKTEIMYKHDCFEIEFDNGEKIVADRDHLWQIGCRANFRGKEKVMTSGEIFDYVEARKNIKDGVSLYVTASKPLELPEATLPIDPYVLGAWLGDGTSRNAQITLLNQDMSELRRHFESVGYAVESVPYSAEFNAPQFNIKGLYTQLREQDLLQNKHIPAVYLRASIEQRLALLQGLMDTDGHARPRGGLEFYQKSEKFCEQVRELLASLGIKSRLRSKVVKGETYHTISFSTSDFPVFRLARKLVIQRQAKAHPKVKRHYIINIKPATSVPVQCITVDNDDHLFLCGRQMIPTHNTVTAAAYLLWWAIFKDHQVVLIASNKGAGAKEIMVHVRNYYEELPEWLKPGLTTDNVFELAFDNKSRIIAETTTVNTGRGKSINLLYLDEFAYVNPSIQKGLWTSVQPTLAATNGRMIITSTPNTDEDKFANIWFGALDAPKSFVWTDRALDTKGLAEKLKSEEYETVYEDPSHAILEEAVVKSNPEDQFGFRRFYIHWNERPDRDEAYKARTLAEGVTMSEWLREYECVFASGDTTLIDSIWLMRLNAYVAKPRLVDKWGVRWYQPIRPNHCYCVVLDPSEGVGGDNGVIQVWSLPDMMQVAEWAKSDCNQIEQAKMLVRILTKIDSTLQDHPDQVGESSLYYSIECNGVGQGVVNMIMNEESNIPGYFIDSDGNKTRGIRTTEPSKKEYSFRLKTMIERGVFIPRSRYLVSELKTFVKRGKNFSAKQGSKDDRVMSCVIMCHMLDELVYHEDGIEELINPRLMGVETPEYDDDESEEEEVMPMPVV